MPTTTHHADPPPPPRPIPREGSITLRVRYTECDPMGLAHHAAYIPWLEMGRTELLRASGIAYATLEAAGVLLVVAKLLIAYKAPARYDDTILLITRVTRGGRARIDHEYELWLHNDPDTPRSTLLATAESTLACVAPDKRPRPLPHWLAPDAHV